MISQPLQYELQVLLKKKNYVTGDWLDVFFLLFINIFLFLSNITQYRYTRASLQ